MKHSSPSFDVLGLGCTAVDDLLYVEHYPPADSKQRIVSRERQCGGLAATALVAATRLGARCAYAGTLGDDEASRFVMNAFAREQINTEHVIRRPSAKPCRSTIVVDAQRKTRNIFYDTADVMGAAPHRPVQSVIRSCRVLLIDRFGVPGMLRAARVAKAAGIPMVGDFENRDWEGFEVLFPLPDHLIVSMDFAGHLTRTTTPAEAVNRLWTSDRACVVVTCGSAGCWYRDREMEHPKRLPAFRIKAVDTTGCGDVFHGAYAAALARQFPLRDRLRVAAAAAALKATRRGGQDGIPAWREVSALIS